MKVSLSPFAPPFVPGTSSGTSANEGTAERDAGEMEESGQVLPDMAYIPVDPAFVPPVVGPLDSPPADMGLWLGHEMFSLPGVGIFPPAQLTPAVYPGGPGPYLPHYAVALSGLPPTCGLYDTEALTSYLYGTSGAPPIQPLAVQPEQPLVSGSMRRRRRKGRSSKSGKGDREGEKEAEPEATEPEPVVAPPVNRSERGRRNVEKDRLAEDKKAKLFMESSCQTDFPLAVAERSLALLPSPLCRSPAPSLGPAFFDRSAVDPPPPPLGSGHRSAAAWTGADLLRNVPPPQLSRQPPPAFSYAAALKSVRRPPPPPPQPPPPPEPEPEVPGSSEEQPVPRKERMPKPQTSQGGGKKKKKKRKAPVIDLEAVMKEQEAARSSAILGSSGGNVRRQGDGLKPMAEEEYRERTQHRPLAMEEFPDLESGVVRAPSKPVPSVWGPGPGPRADLSGRLPGVLPIRPTEAPARGSGPLSLFEAASVRHLGDRHPSSGPGTRTDPFRPQPPPSLPQPALPTAPRVGQTQESSVKTVPSKPKPPGTSSKTKFVPLFSIGGSGAGSAQAPLFRPKDLPSTTSLSRKAVNIDIPARPPVEAVKEVPAKRVAGVPKMTKGVNPLDSNVTVKRGKEREKPKPKRPTPMKQIILRERQAKKETRSSSLSKQEAREGLELGAMSCPETGRSGRDSDSDSDADLLGGAVSAPEDAGMEKEKEEEVEAEGGGKEIPDGEAVVDRWESLVDSSDAEAQGGEEKEEKEEEEAKKEAATPGLHSRRFREYCDQMIGKAVNECVLAILADLVRFQDRLHQRDPVKAKQRRRLVYGIKEVTKHLRLSKVRLVIISPDVEKIESKGGLDEAIRTILDLCTQQGVIHVFSLPRRLLGRACMKAVPVSVVGVFNYDGTEQNVRRLMELVEEGRRQYRLVTRIMEQEDGEDEEKSSHRREHSRNASNVSEPISDLPGGHSRQSSLGGPVNLVLRPLGAGVQGRQGTGGEYEADDEAEEA